MTAETERCEELRNALKDARARLETPTSDTAYQGALSARILDPGDTTPDADPGVREDIRHIEQALRDAGCDPD